MKKTIFTGAELLESLIHSIRYPLVAYRTLDSKSALINKIFFELRQQYSIHKDCLAEFLFELNSLAYLTRYPYEQTKQEIEDARVSFAPEMVFQEVTDWNNYNQIYKLMGRILYQCSEFEASNALMKEVNFVEAMKNKCAELQMEKLLLYKDLPRHVTSFR